MANTMIREAVGVFPDASSMQRAVDDMLLQGIDRSYLSLLAPRAVVERALGRFYDRPEEIEDDPAVPRMAYVGTDSRVEGRSACAGAFAYAGATAVAGAVAALDASVVASILATVSVGGAGGVLGAMLGIYFDRARGREMRAQVAQGGVPLWVRLYSDAWEDVICDTLRLQGARHVHVHEIVREEAAVGGGVSQHFAWIDKPLAPWLMLRPSPRPQ